jgi:hypothetical protein
MSWVVCQASRVSFLPIVVYMVLPFSRHAFSEDAIRPVPKCRELKLITFLYTYIPIYDFMSRRGQRRMLLHRMQQAWTKGQTDARQPDLGLPHGRDSGTSNGQRD